MIHNIRSVSNSVGKVMINNPVANSTKQNYMAITARLLRRLHSEIDKTPKN